MGTQRGTTTVEFAVVSVTLFILLFGVIEIARALFVWNTISEATRRGARVAAVCPLNHADVARVAVFGPPGGGDGSPILNDLTTANVTVRYLNGTGSDTVNYANIRYVEVGVQNYTHTLFIPFLPPAARSIPLPPFTTRLPAESLGYIPDINTRQCYGG